MLRLALLADPDAGRPGRRGGLRGRAGIVIEDREAQPAPLGRRGLALVPLGYPARGRWAQPKRLSVDQVVHWDHWGTTRPWT